MALLAIALLAAPAAAQRRPQWDTDILLRNKEMRQVVREYGHCVVDRRHDEAAEVILNNETNREIVRRHSKLVDSSCLKARTGGGLQARFPGDTLRYTLAEALVRADFPTAFPPGIASAGPIVHKEPDAEYLTPPQGRRLRPKQLAELERRKNEALGSVYLSRFGECVVRADPSSAHRLLMTEPLSAGESAAFLALAPKLSDCLEGGLQFRTNKETLRGTIAHNFYRLAKAPRIVAQGTTP